MKEYQYPVVIEYDPDNDVYLADCPPISKFRNGGMKGG